MNFKLESSTAAFGFGEPGRTESQSGGLFNKYPDTGHADSE